jgi:phosphoribosyl 1,2-cyclic phosphate phosphodiesterase
MKVTVLGCGGSGGVPLIGNDWGECDPADPRNRRRRSSVLVDVGTVRLLIDTGPDLREQLLAAGVTHLDGVLFSHSHADHSHGIDELRALNWVMRQPIDCYADAATLADLEQRFGYCLKPLPDGAHFYRPALVPRLAVPGQPFTVKGVEIRPFLQDHGLSNTLGFRIGNFAYSTDVVRLDEAAFAALDGVEVWMVDCVRIQPPHTVHAHLPVTLSWIERVRPRRAVLTHMNQTMDYAKVSALLPPGVEPAYDGMVVEL